MYNFFESTTRTGTASSLTQGYKEAYAALTAHPAILMEAVCLPGGEEWYRKIFWHLIQ